TSTGNGTIRSTTKQPVCNDYCFSGPKPLASSVYVHALEAPSPLRRSISVTYLFPSFVPFSLFGPGEILGVKWSAPQKLVQPKWESPGRLTHGGTHEKAKDRRGSGAVAARSRPRSSQGTDSL